MKLNQIFKKRLHKKMLSGVEMVKIGVLDRLTERYQPVYGEETTDLLAAAVVNEFFSQKPSDHAFQEFSEVNKEVVKREICNLMQDEEMCRVISQAVRVQVLVSNEQVRHAQEATLEPLERLKGFDMLAIDEETLTPRAFLDMASEFYQRRP